MAEVKNQPVPKKEATPEVKAPEVNKPVPKKEAIKFDRIIYNEFIELKFIELKVKAADDSKARLTPEFIEKLAGLEAQVSKYPGEKPTMSKTYMIENEIIRFFVGIPVPAEDYKKLPKTVIKKCFKQ